MTTQSMPRGGVLIADPSPHMASLVAAMLRHLGRRDLRETYDAKKTMDELKHRLFDVLIIDDALDGMDSVELTRALRATTDCDNRYVPIIMMSAAPDAKRIADARDAGVTEFLRKPFAANHLLTRLTSIEANPRGFVEARDFKGPDRRRRTAGFHGQERRAEDPVIITPKAV